MQVGDYARTKKRGFQPPQIARIRSMGKDSGYHNQYYIELDHNLIPDYEFRIYEEDIEKSSPNIIDLIEVGDYVNGWPVVKHAHTGDLYTTYVYVGGKGFTTFEDYCTELKTEDEDFIESIVTKEQFEAMEYKVGVDKE